MFCYKMLEAESDRILAICDKDIVGKTFSAGELAITVDPSFYGKETCGEAEALRLSKEATIINAVGNDIIDLLVANKIVEKSNIIRIGRVKHAQVIAIV